MPTRIQVNHSRLYQQRLAQACGAHARHRIYHGIVTQMITDQDPVNIKYSEEYDAYYNQKTNEWTESKCDDPTCKYCANRPERPLVDK